MNQSTTYLPNLTPLRGIAALLTVIYHVDLFLGMGGDVLVKFADSSLLSRMYLMVDFFFVLSGFIMCHVYGNWFTGTVQRSDFRRFTIARFARVYPLHLAMLLAAVLIFGVSRAAGIPENPVLETENSVYSFITNLLLLQSMNLHKWFSWVHASWSISTDWWMYMLFPFLVRPIWRMGTLGRVGVVTACIAGYVSIMLFFVPQVTFPDSLSFFRTSNPPLDNINVAFQYGFLRCLFGFVLGMITYQVYRRYEGIAWLANGYALLLLTLGVGLCLHFGVPDVFTVSWYPFILLSAAYGSRQTDRILGTRPFQRIGDWSFSIYLVHQPLLFIFNNISVYQSLGKPSAGGPPPKPDMLTGWLLCLIFVCITLLAARFTYQVIEVPARRWLNQHWGQRPVALPANVPAAGKV
ncbi:acyltransferase [Nibrella viscosa]|uniref:Acyltransferase n=1 Tax=Nibrella viscosa TaxID=1084524 RepID=A0ABP8K665_9BACT